MDLFSRNGLTEDPYMDFLSRNGLTEDPYMDFLSRNGLTEGPYMEIGSKFLKIQIQNMSFLNSTAKSQAPDPPIRSVSSSEYRRFPRGPKLTTFLGPKLIFL